MERCLPELPYDPPSGYAGRLIAPNHLGKRGLKADLVDAVSGTKVADHSTIIDDRGASADGEPRTLVHSAYLALRKNIIEGHLPPGSKLKVELLKEFYKVGAGTLREALLLLASDALIVIQGQRGFRVADMSPSDFRDITETRVLLECHALRMSILSGGDAWEASLVAAFHLLGRIEKRLGDRPDDMFDEWESANKAFHEALIGGCDSICTRRFLSILYNQAERYRRVLLPNRPETRNVHREHEAIFAAAIERDADAATRFLADHIRFNLQNLKKFSDAKTDTLAI